MKFLEGKKTYIAAALLVLLAAAGFWFDYIPAVEATAIVIAGLGLFGLGDKADRYGRLLMAYIEAEKKKRAAEQPDEADTIIKRLADLNKPGGATKN